MNRSGFFKMLLALPFAAKAAAKLAEAKPVELPIAEPLRIPGFDVNDGSGRGNLNCVIYTNAMESHLVHRIQ